MRLIHEKYSKGSYATSEVIKIQNPNIYRLLEWLETKLKLSEVIDILYWTQDWHYIIVEDRTITGSIANMRVGFTVNIRKDIIMWNNDTSDNPYGGNCFVRSNKWKNLLRNRFGSHYHETQINIHKDRRLQK